ncbi:hypothetical protein B0J14DRAFT_661180 [Halenospora varia]|nr:hypothetical protein B0J14DRAFT_661180 [Halenospora varia]
MLTNKTRKTLLARKQARKDTEATGDINRACAFEFTGQNGGRGTWLEEVAWLIAELKTELQAVNYELKTGNKELKAHTKTLIKELAEVKTQLVETRL